MVDRISPTTVRTGPNLPIVPPKHSGFVGGVQDGLGTRLFASIGIGSALTANVTTQWPVDRLRNEFWVDDSGILLPVTGYGHLYVSWWTKGAGTQGMCCTRADFRAA